MDGKNGSQDQQEARWHRISWRIEPEPPERRRSRSALARDEIAGAIRDVAQTPQWEEIHVNDWPDKVIFPFRCNDCQWLACTDGPHVTQCRRCGGKGRRKVWRRNGWLAWKDAIS